MKYLVVAILLLYALQAGSCRSPRVETEKLSLIEAIKKGDTESVLASLREGTDPNKPDQYGTPPLHWACYADKTGLVTQALLKYAANVSIQDKGGSTVLDWIDKAWADKAWADEERHTAALAHLIEAAIVQEKLDIPSENGKTLLHFAVLLPGKKGAEMLHSLLQSGLDPNLQDNKGRTPLHYAVENKKIDITAIDSLLKAGASPYIRDSKGAFPLYCVDSDRKDVLYQLLRWPLAINLPTNSAA